MEETQNSPTYLLKREIARLNIYNKQNIEEGVEILSDQIVDKSTLKLDNYKFIYTWTLSKAKSLALLNASHTKIFDPLHKWYFRYNWSSKNGGTIIIRAKMVDWHRDFSKNTKGYVCFTISNQEIKEELLYNYGQYRDPEYFTLFEHKLMGSESTKLLNEVKITFTYRELNLYLFEDHKFIYRVPYANAAKKRKYDDNFVIISNGSKFDVDKFILAEHSDYFRGLVRSYSKENLENAMEIKDFSDEAVENMIAFCYGLNGLVWSDDVKSIIEILQITDLYLIDGLKKRAEKELLRMVTFENIFECLEVARTYNAVETLQKLQKFLKKNLITMLQDVSMVEKIVELNGVEGLIAIIE